MQDKRIYDHFHLLKFLYHCYYPHTPRDLVSPVCPTLYTTGFTALPVLGLSSIRPKYPALAFVAAALSKSPVKDNSHPDYITQKLNHLDYLELDSRPKARIPYDKCHPVTGPSLCQGSLLTQRPKKLTGQFLKLILWTSNCIGIRRKKRVPSD